MQPSYLKLVATISSNNVRLESELNFDRERTLKNAKKYKITN